MAKNLERYANTVWINDKTRLNAANLNKIENALVDSRDNEIANANAIAEVLLALTEKLDAVYEDNQLTITLGDQDTPNIAKVIRTSIDLDACAKKLGSNSFTGTNVFVGTTGFQNSITVSGQDVRLKLSDGAKISVSSKGDFVETSDQNGGSIGYKLPYDTTDKADGTELTIAVKEDHYTKAEVDSIVSSSESAMAQDTSDAIDDKIQAKVDELSLGDTLLDAKVNGNSLVHNRVASLTLSNGLSFSNGSVGLTLSTLPEVVPKGMTLGEQGDVQLLAERNGVVSRVSAGKLDYTRLKVQEEEDLAKVAVNDFLFIKEG